MKLSLPDICIILVYLVGIFALAQWVSREKRGHEKNSKDYFLAGKTLPWWAIGTSLIAANISAEQIIGMSGSGYALGIAIASYEWMAALTLLIVGKFFLPVFLRNNINTMPQFLENRYGPRIRTVMAVFWLVLYVFVNLTSILWLGSIAVSQVTGIDQFAALVLLGVFSLSYQLYGGLKAVALTDFVQVGLLIAGGLAITALTLARIGGDGGILGGFAALQSAHPEHFHMILRADNPFYKDLPGMSVLFGGLWVMNLSYWGFNQYIIQRGLAAKSIEQAQGGVLLAAFLKLLVPLIVVVPGIAAVVVAPNLAAPDQAYPTMMSLLPSGVLGLVFAALVAADGIAGVEDQFHRDDLHARFLHEVQAADERRQDRRGRPHRRVRRRRHRRTERQAVARQFRSGVPVHPGFHRLLHPRHHRDFLAGTFLATRERGRCAGRGDRFGRAVDRHQAAHAGGAVHESRRLGVPARDAARHRRLADDRGAERRRHNPHG